MIPHKNLILKTKAEVLLQGHVLTTEPMRKWQKYVGIQEQAETVWFVRGEETIAAFIKIKSSC